MKKIKEYDIKKLHQAWGCVYQVYGFVFGSGNRRIQWRLETILNKLEELIKICEEEEE